MQYNIRKKIETERLKQGLSWRQIHLLSGVRYATIKDFLSGRAESISIPNLEKICDLLKLGLTPISGSKDSET